MCFPTCLCGRTNDIRSFPGLDPALYSHKEPDAHTCNSFHQSSSGWQLAYPPEFDDPGSIKLSIQLKI